MDRDTEKVLLQQIKEGNFFIYETFITEYQNRVYGFIFGLVKNEEDARDLCQETFFKAYKSLRSFKGQSKFSTWLFQIAYFQSLNFLKRKKKQKDVLQKMDKILHADKHSQEMERDEINKKIESVLNKIPLNSRTALHLFYKEERNYREIASIMKIPLNSVKSLIFRGKEDIRKRLSKDLPLDPLTN